MKTCSRCGVEYPATTEYFQRSKAVKCGLKSHCKECAKEMNRESHAKYYEANKDKVKEKNLANYYRRNPKEVLLDGHKRCSVCDEVKSLDEFSKSSKAKDGYKGQCKECRRKEYLENREHYKGKSIKRYRENKQEHKAKTKEYREKNIEWYQDYNRRYYEENSEKIKEASKKSLYRRIESDHGFKILQRLRKRMYEAVKGSVKSARTIELIGCSVEELKKHLENQFQDGMSWENYGEWHVDHIIPCSLFDFTKPEDQRACFHYTNLQPLWAIDNIRKSNKLL